MRKDFAGLQGTHAVARMEQEQHASALEEERTKMSEKVDALEESQQQVASLESQLLQAQPL